MIGSLKGRLLRISVPECAVLWDLHDQLQAHPLSLKEHVLKHLLLCLARLGSGYRASKARGQADLQFFRRCSLRLGRLSES